MVTGLLIALVALNAVEVVLLWIVASGMLVTLADRKRAMKRVKVHNAQRQDIPPVRP